ncbi:unnamed protein product [Cyprideis torosa]|uniref:Uncharacterized protein n=1 Tax=Cyprideis torosa TaxID=163714 RepID=A0A7R8ZRV1_9CRUS|nr:unnamed protein product [Cyprideis torosa]CAG0899971.1 unnamed protein product [Cyprideis torosa]
MSKTWAHSAHSVPGIPHNEASGAMFACTGPEIRNVIGLRMIRPASQVVGQWLLAGCPDHKMGHKGLASHMETFAHHPEYDKGFVDLMNDYDHGIITLKRDLPLKLGYVETIFPASWFEMVSAVDTLRIVSRHTFVQILLKEAFAAGILESRSWDILTQIWTLGRNQRQDGRYSGPRVIVSNCMCDFDDSHIDRKIYVINGSANSSTRANSFSGDRFLPEGLLPTPIDSYGQSCKRSNELHLIDRKHSRKI